ncbi:MULTISPECIES: ATP-binding protein [unclassified Nonomuraea]|uniref:ATP-binding protein n=1 Tax=Nonomuraea sp. NPDC047529 TaxID=3155623 RepID=UPI003403CCEE
MFPFHESTASEPGCVAMARRFVDQTLTSWAVADVAFDMQLVVSELVTNAMRHGGGAVQLRLLFRRPELACVVTDHSQTVPVAAQTDVFAEFGRGLRLVDALCSAWGWFAPGSSRKLVWAVLST